MVFMLNQFQLFNQLLAITACLFIQQCLLVLQNMGQMCIVHIQRPSIINYKSFIIEFLSQILLRGMVPRPGYRSAK